MGRPYQMSYESYTQEGDEQNVDEPAERRGMMREGITQLPGYESLQARLKPARAEQRPTKDVIFDILRNRRRRYVLEYLHKHEGVVELSELAESLATWESEDDYITHRDRKRAYVSLYQTHLPKLDRAGVVEYNQSRGRVELGPYYRDLTGYMQYSHDYTLWHRLYLGGAITSVSSLGLAQLTAFPFVAVPDAMWFALMLVVFGSILLAHTITDGATPR